MGFNPAHYQTKKVSSATFIKDGDVLRAEGWDALAAANGMVTIIKKLPVVPAHTGASAAAVLKVTPKPPPKRKLPVAPPPRVTRNPSVKVIQRPAQKIVPAPEPAVGRKVYTLDTVPTHGPRDRSKIVPRVTGPEPTLPARLKGV
jgi:hypothetical protein